MIVEKIEFGLGFSEIKLEKQIRKEPSWRW